MYRFAVLALRRLLGVPDKVDMYRADGWRFEKTAPARILMSTMVQVSASMGREELSMMGDMVGRAHLSPNEPDLKHERCDVDVYLKGQLGPWWKKKKTRRGNTYAIGEGVKQVSLEALAHRVLMRAVTGRSEPQRNFLSEAGECCPVSMSLAKWTPAQREELL